MGEGEGVCIGTKGGKGIGMGLGGGEKSQGLAPWGRGEKGLHICLYVDTRRANGKSGRALVQPCLRQLVAC